MRERVFEKDGHEVTTESPTAAVDLIARGYREVLDDDPPGDVRAVRRFETRLPGESD